MNPAKQLIVADTARLWAILGGELPDPEEALSWAASLKRIEKAVDIAGGNILPLANAAFSAGVGTGLYHGASVKAYTPPSKYEFPEYIQKMEEELKQAKSSAIARGEALKQITPFDPEKNRSFSVTASITIREQDKDDLREAAKILAYGEPESEDRTPTS